MTLLEKLKIEHPEEIDPEEAGGVVGCPAHYGYETSIRKTYCCEDCDACWGREYQEPQQDGRKDDQGKLRLDLIPTSAYTSVGRVLTHGASKYGDNTWQGVEPKRYTAALLRHLVAYLDNPGGKDEESGLYHSEHLLCNAMFLNHFREESTKNEGDKPC